MADGFLVPRPPRLPAERAPLPRGIEKAAVLLMTLGPEAAASVLRHLSEQEVRQLTAAITRLRSIPRATAAAVHEEAWRRLTEKDGFLVDGEDFARRVVTAAAAAQGGRNAKSQAMIELERAAEAGRQELSKVLERVAPGVLAGVLATEHPQAIALTIANLRPKQAAEVLAALPETLQADIVHRITELQNVPEEVLDDVGVVIRGQLAGLGAAAQGARAGAGRAKLAAEIMNVIDKAVEARVLGELDEQAPEVAETIRQLMFTFEDMLQLENRDVQVVLKEVAREDLMLALKTASPAMKEKIFKNISARAAEILEEDMSALGAVKLKDVERAQLNIVAVVRRLEAEQKITIAAGGDDVVV
jgi:flagellar motor switch protein FliG